MRIILMCGTSLDEFQQAVLAPILSDHSIEIAEAIIDNRPKPSAKKRFLKNLKRGRGGYMLVMLVRSRLAKQRPSVDSCNFLTAHNVACTTTTQPYASETIERLRTLHADTMVMLGGFGIVKEPLLSLTPNGILSYHHGDMRHYRGQPVGFWELYNHEPQMGVTVQRLSAQIDKGVPIVEKTITIGRSDNQKTLSNKALHESTDMMHTALHLIAQPDFSPSPIDHYGPIYTLPNLRQYITLQIKLLFR